MPVTARLSRKFYDRFNELNYARFDAKLEQRFAEFGAKWEQRFADLQGEFESRAGYRTSQSAVDVDRRTCLAYDSGVSQTVATEGPGIGARPSVLRVRTRVWRRYTCRIPIPARYSNVSS